MSDVEGHSGESRGPPRRLGGDRHLEQLWVLRFLRNGFARGHQVLQVQRDRLLRVSDAFFGGLTLRDATWKSRHGYRVPPFGVRVDNNRVRTHSAPNYNRPLSRSAPIPA